MDPSPMKTSRPHARLAVLSLAVAAALPQIVEAQTRGALRDTVVTATRSEQPIADLVSDVSIVDRETIERSGVTGVADVLARLPGVQMSRNGGPGTQTSVFLRGAESRFTAVYLDGVRLDSQATGGVQWEQIPLSQIDRIEVLRGPAAAVYGSDAIGGVIQLFTRKGDGAPAPYVGIGAGSQRTRKIEAGVSGSTGVDKAFDYSLGVAHEESQGFNARPDRLALPRAALNNPDLDGFRTNSGNARVGLQINRDHRVEATLLASSMSSQYDGFGYVAANPQDDHNEHRLRTAGATWTAQWTEAYKTRLQITDSHNRYATEPSFYLTTTDLRGYLWQNEYRIGAHLLTATLERREDALVNSPIDQERSQNALGLGYGFNQGGHTLQLQVRRDRDSEFGGKNTGSAAYGYAITRQLRATVSAGTAFRVPTLYQRFSQYGVASLQPETSRNVEAGLRWTDGPTSVGATVYRSRVKNLIVFSTPGACADSFGCYANVGRAEYEGVTLQANHSIAGVQLRGSVDFQDPRDLDSGKQLARRARRYGTFGADTSIAGWTVGTELQVSGQKWDNAANTTRIGGYGIVNLYASTKIARDFTVTARIDNIADRDYEIVRTYATAGRVVWVGIKWSPA